MVALVEAPHCCDDRDDGNNDDDNIRGGMGDDNSDDGRDDDNMRNYDPHMDADAVAVADEVVVRKGAVEEADVAAAGLMQLCPAIRTGKTGQLFSCCYDFVNNICLYI
jgi:hypothetical protein